MILKRTAASLWYLTFLCFLVIVVSKHDSTSRDAPKSAACRKALEDDDAAHGLELLQLRGLRVSKETCPAPESGKGVQSSMRKGCPEDPEANPYSCLNDNSGYRMLEDAWEHCGNTAECGVVMEDTDGLYYLRRSSDPDLDEPSGVKMFVYNCKARVENEAQALAHEVQDEFKTITELGVEQMRKTAEMSQKLEVIKEKITSKIQKTSEEARKAAETEAKLKHTIEAGLDTVSKAVTSLHAVNGNVEKDEDHLNKAEAVFKARHADDAEHGSEDDSEYDAEDDSEDDSADESEENFLDSSEDSVDFEDDSADDSIDESVDDSDSDAADNSEDDSALHSEDESEDGSRDVETEEARHSEEKARKKRESEARRRAEEEEARHARQAEAKKRAKKARQAKEAEVRRRAEEEEARQARQQAEAKKRAKKLRQAREAEARRRAEEEEEAREARQAEDKKLAKKARQAKRAEARRRAEEEEARKARKAEDKKRAKEQEEARIRQMEEARWKKQEEARRHKREARRKKQEEARIQQQEAARREAAEWKRQEKARIQKQEEAKQEEAKKHEEAVRKLEEEDERRAARQAENERREREQEAQEMERERLAKEAAAAEVYRGPGHDYCANSNGVIEESESSGTYQCKARCAKHESCNYVSFWETGGANWCRLSSTCDELGQQPDHTIYIFHKAATVKEESAKTKLADAEPAKAKPPKAGRAKTEAAEPEVTKSKPSKSESTEAARKELFKGPGTNFCDDSNGVISKASSSGKDECKERCESEPSCKYFSLWESGGVNWCSLTKSCDELGQESEHTIRIYRKVTSDARTKAKEVQGQEDARGSPYLPGTADEDLYKGPGTSYCADSNGVISKSSSSGKEDCEARCTADSSCHYFSLWATGGVNWCHLSKACDVLSEETEHSIRIYRKARPEAAPEKRRKSEKRQKSDAILSDAEIRKSEAQRAVVDAAEAEANKAKAKDIDDQMERLKQHSAAIERLKEELAKAKEQLRFDDEPVEKESEGSEPPDEQPAQLQLAPATGSKAELTDAGQAKAAQGMSHMEKSRTRRSGIYTKLEDMGCGWAGSWDDPNNSCGMANQAYVHGEERSRSNVAREQVLDVCGRTCTEAGDTCDGFMWQASSSTCFFRKNAKCGVSQSTGDVCFQKGSGFSSDEYKRLGALRAELRRQRR